MSGLIPFGVERRDNLRRRRRREGVVHIHTLRKRRVGAGVGYEDVKMDGILVTDPSDDEIGTIDSVPIGYS